MKIRRNVAFNLLGFLLPAVIVFASYPLLLRGLGASQFGILALAMSVAAALSFLDFGLAAASLRYVVADLHSGEARSAGRVMTTSIAFFGALGVFITLVVLALSPLLVHVLGIPDAEHELAKQVLRLTALQIGFTLLLNTIGGLFKAIDRFDLAALVVTLIAFAGNAVPALQVFFLGVGLPIALATAAALMAVAALAMIALLDRKSRSFGISLRRDRPDRATFQRTFAFGATLTVHGLIGMVFVHGQRLLVGALFGPIAVAAYQLSLTLVSKIHAAINAAAEVALPMASSGQLNVVRRHYVKAMLTLGAMSAAPLLFVALGSDWVIHLWLGNSAPPLTAHLLPPLCLAYFFVAMSALPYHILNGIGRPGVNVGFAVFNIVVYVLALLGFEVLHVMTPEHVAHAYAIANIACGVLYQWFCMRFLARHSTSLSTNERSSRIVATQPNP